jgi:hypothetical protein
MADTLFPQLLLDRAVIRLSGESVLPFLHNIITADVVSLAAGQTAYGALLSPQGKIQHEMFVTNMGGSVAIDCVRSQRDDLLRKLTMYRLRANIEMHPDDSLGVYFDPTGKQAADPRLAALGERSLKPFDFQAAIGKNYDALRMMYGIPDGERDIGVNVHFPHEANLDLLNGLSFSKGCYVGQEVVSRMQHRGTARSRMLPVALGRPLPREGSAITSGKAHIGTMLSSFGMKALALIRLDRLAEAQAPLLSEGVKIQVQVPAWMTIDIVIPEAAL